MLTGKAWEDVNTLVSYLDNDVDIIDRHYLGFGNDAPGKLLRLVIGKLQKHLDEGSRDEHPTSTRQS